MKKRLQVLEKARRHKMKPNNGCAMINYPDNQMTDEEKEEYTKQGIKIINVEYV